MSVGLMSVLDRLLDSIPKRFTLAVLTVCGAVILLATTYGFIQRALTEAKREYITAIFQYCEQASETVARITSATQYPVSRVDDFWALYYGKLILVEDETLEHAMVRFGDALAKQNQERFDGGSLRKQALDVSGACRDLVRKGWALQIEPWKDLREKRAK